MNKLYFLFIIVLVVFMSCDGRNRVFKTNQQVLIENNQFDSFSESIKYFPETYVEMQIDTVLSNGHNIHIRFYSNMNNEFLVEKQKDAITNKTYYREFVAEIEIYKNSSKIFNSTINADFLLNKGILTKAESNQYLVKSFWLETYDDIHNGAPILFLDYADTKSEKKKLFKLTFLEDNCLIEEIT